MVVLVVMF